MLRLFSIQIENVIRMAVCTVYVWYMVKYAVRIKYLEPVVSDLMNYGYKKAPFIGAENKENYKQYLL